MRRMKVMGFFALMLTLGAVGAAASPAVADVAINDNRRAAGTLDGQTLTIHLRAAAGAWRPEGARGPALSIEAFGEENGPLQVPAPLIRIRQGTEIRATVRNDLEFAMRVHGLCTRGGGAACAPVDVAPGQTREIRFAAGAPGTYDYWATTTGMPLPFRATGDTTLSGAFIVDPT